MAKRFLIRLGTNAVALWVAAAVIPGMAIDGDVLDYLLLALIFGLVNALIGPVMRLLTLPLTLMTLGLFTLVVNGVLLLITAWISSSLNFDGGFFTQFGAAVIAAFVISAVSLVLTKLVPNGK
jgi:putative membrane protein